KAAGQLFDTGRLAVVQGVGYPNPDRSHFRSMAIWQTGRLAESEHGQYGWLGRTLDERSSSDASSQAVFTGNGSVPVTLWGRRSTCAAIKSLDELALTAPMNLVRGAS